MDPSVNTYKAPRAPVCLIVGCGYVGQRLASRLARQGRVHALARSDHDRPLLRELGVDQRRIDLDGTDFADDDLQGLAAGAAIVYLVPPPDSGTADPRVHRFLRSLGDARPAVVVYVSTTGVYGDAGGAVVTEFSALAPGTDRARRRVAAERTVNEWCATRGVRYVVLRVPGIYGPGRLPLDRLARGEPALRREDAGPGNRIHVDDLVSACVAALQCSASGIFNVTDGDHASTTDFLSLTAELADLAPPRLVSLDEAREQISPGMLGFLTETRRVDNRRMCEVLKVALAYPDLRAGIAASLAEMRTTVRE